MKTANQLIVLLIVSAVAAACQRKNAAPQEEVVRPVRVEQPRLSSANGSHTFSGTVKAGTETKLSFKVGGTLTKLNLKVGDELNKGQFVASVEARDQSLQVQSMQANVTQAEAQLRNAEAQYQRVRALYANNNSTRTELDSARMAHDSAKASLAATKKQLELAHAQAGKTVLRSPLAGVVAQVNAESGENVSPGQPIVVLNSGSRAEVEVAVPETIISRIKVGQPGTATLAALDGKQLPVSVTEVGVTTSQTKTTYPVVLAFDEEDESVRSGMVAEVSITLGSSHKPQLLVNPKAVGEDRNGRFVFVAVPAGEGFATVERRPVEVGQIGTDGMEITSGVKATELVVTAGLTYLTDGKRVRLPSDVEAKESVKKVPDPAQPKNAPAEATPTSKPAD
jgi:RND family efflux transporter MFP subunit